MKYFFYNPETKQSEGPYSIDMLRDFVPAPLPPVNNEDDDFIHPFSKKGIKLQQKTFLRGQGWIWIISGSFTLLMEIFLYFFFLRYILSFLGSSTILFAFIPLTTIGLILIILGIYQLKKGKKINPDK
jgi:hypothetical protein